MIKKDRIDYKLVNITLIAFTIFLIYSTGNLWTDAVKKFFSIVMPFIVAFALAYALTPLVDKMNRKGIPRGVAVTIVILATLGLIVFVGYVVTSIFVGQLSDLFARITDFVAQVNDNDWKLNVAGLQTSMNDTFQAIITDITKYVSNGAINLIGTSLNFLGKVLIGFAAYVYFLIDMDKIRIVVKKFFKNRSEKTYNFIKLLDGEMKKYLSGLVQVMVISAIEYTIAYSIIGHPNAVLLGFLACVANLIPYFGGIGCNVIASITAFVVSPSLFIKTIITFFILSTIDGYVINPAVYGKSNSIHPLITIFALFAGGAIFGIIGIFISFPLAIILVSAYKYYKDDINVGIEKLKDSGKVENEA